MSGPVVQEAVEAIATRRLANGVRVNLIVSSDPSTADVAICSSDPHGDPGSLNQLVFGAAGLDPDRLHRRFKPPAEIIHDGRFPILVIETVGAEGDTANLLRVNLQAGLALLGGLRRSHTIWLPLLGTGAGKLPYTESAEIILDALSSWAAPGGTELVELAAPSRPIAAQVMALIAEPVHDAATEAGVGGPQVLGNLERHVAIALHVATGLAHGRLVGPLDVLTAAVSVADGASSPAFTELTNLVGLTAGHQLQDWSGSPVPAEVSCSSLDPDLARWLQWAGGPQAPGQAGRIWGRDLVTSALLCQDATMADALERVGTPLEVVRERWYAFVTKDAARRSRSEWQEWWRAAGVSLPGPRRAGYAADTDHGEDKLGVEPDAAAFARLILDKEVTPPLSIGLLGDWGSGKSFFMQQIRKQVAALRGQPGLLEHVVEIEFNAWHASDASLWASLVTQIFDGIWRSVDVEGAETDPADARRQLADELKKAGGALHEADAEVSLARETLKQAEEHLADRRSQLAWTSMVTSLTTTELLEVARKAGWQEPLEIINEVEGAARRLSDGRARFRIMLSALADQPIRAILFPALLGVAAVGAVVALAHVGVVADFLSRLGISGAFPVFLSRLAGAAAAVLAPLRLASVRVRKLAASLDLVAKEYHEHLRADEASAPELVAKVREARRELDGTEVAVAAASAHLADLQNRLAALEPGRRLGAFLQDRVQSSQYRAQQGIIALVHKDFQQLAERMRDWRTDRATGASVEAGHIRPFDRIVIYVDDLDRCRPDHVVNMLEAVHLLLALDLFVVVVAVDSRWLACSLEVHYKDLLETGDRAREDGSLRASTAQNYLEKIFQITYALAPMSKASFPSYAASLTGLARSSSEIPLVGPDQGARDQEVIQKRESLSPALGRIATHDGHSTAVQGPPGPRPPAPLPRPVSILPVEQDFLCGICSLLPTPRIAKRVVNVYRLIKAGKTGDELVVFERERAKPCLLMLAILFGHPAVSLELLRKLHQGDPPFHQAEETLVSALDIAMRKGGEGSEWESLLRDLEQVDDSTTVGQCAREAQEAARYSLVTGRDWHTWRRRAVKDGAPHGSNPQQGRPRSEGRP